MNMATKFWLLIGLLSIGPGCSLVNNAARNVEHEVFLCAEELAEKHRFGSMAEEALAQFSSGSSEGAISEDFADGFKEGYVDHLLRGGNGQLPTLPPRKYWKARYESPQGYMAIEQWF